MVEKPFLLTGRKVCNMFRLAVIIGSTRPGRNGEAVAKWIYEIARQRTDIEVELVDIKDYNLPLLDEPQPASTGQYTQAHTKKWSEKIDSFDGFVFVTPEYNHSPPASLKNAIDYLFFEWNNKSAGFVGYGSMGAIRAIEQLRILMGAIMVADVRAEVMLSLFEDFEKLTEFKPNPRHEKTVNNMLAQIIAWGNALKPLREDE